MPILPVREPGLILPTYLPLQNFNKHK